MIRLCICGKPIKPKQRLCPACLQLYGKDPKAWPDWLREWIRLNQSELDQERRHLETAFNEDLYNSDASGFKSRSKKNQWDYDRDEVSQDNYINPATGLTLSNADMALLYPGSFFDHEADKRSIYDNASLEGLPPDEQSARTWSANKYQVPDYGQIPTLAERDALDDLITMYQMLNTLPDRERLIIGLFLEGYNFTEIARLQGVSPQAISKIYNQVVKRLTNASNI